MIQHVVSSQMKYAVGLCSCAVAWRIDGLVWDDILDFLDYVSLHDGWLIYVALRIWLFSLWLWPAFKIA